MLNANYVVGLIDGEGSFTVYIKTREDSKERKRRARIEPKFYVKLINKDRAILEELKKFFQCGNVYLQKDRRPTHKDCYRFEVTRRSDLSEKIIPFFQKNHLQLISKKNDFHIFCQIMKAVNNNEHLTDSGLEKLRKMKKRMH